MRVQVMSEKNRDLSKEFESFFIKNYPKVKSFARHLLMGEQDAEDIAQEVFLKIAGRPAIWQDPERSGKYLFAMTKNHIFNVIKHRNIERKYEKTVVVENPIAEEFGIVDNLYAKELELLIQYCIEQMPPQRKDIIRMSRFKGMSNAEISESLNLSVRTVERHIYLALKELKKTIA
jgi:RNA polymerase sigma-70 factor (ECF subfamily)